MTRSVALVVSASITLAVGPGPGCKGKSKPAKTEASEHAPAPPVVLDAAASSSARDAAIASKRSRRARLVSIGIVPDHPLKPVEIYPERLARQLGMQLTATKWFGAETRPLPDGVEGRDATIRLQIKYDYRVDKRGALATLVAIEAEQQWQDGGSGLRPIEKVILQRTLAKKQRTMDPAEHVAEVIAHAVHLVGVGLIAKAELVEADRDRLLIALGKLDEDIVMWALAITGHRKIASLFDTVVKLLGSTHRAVREAAVGCLIELGDRRAVPHLAKLAEFRDHRLLTIVIDAVASLGGEEAGEFLDFLASGHGNADIRAQAVQARKRMQRGKGHGKRAAP